MPIFSLRRLLPLLLAAAACTRSGPHGPDAMPQPSADALLDAMRVAVPREANRPVSFTNKAAAYYFTQTHDTNHPEWSWFEGMNVAKNRVFGGYELFVGGVSLDNRAAEATVYPHKLVRRHPAAGVTEELRLLDERNLLDVRVTGARGPLGLQLKGDKVTFLRQEQNVAFFTAREGQFRIAVAPRQAGQPLTVRGQRAEASGGEGFYLAVGPDEAAAAALIQEAQREGEKLQQAQQQRLGRYLLGDVYVRAADDSLTQALRWLAATTDQLVTRQQGDGIYAGLPWFNEYWGRDEFISLPGAVLVTGQFEPARRILLAFARYQQTDPQSRYYGRVPNIVNPSNIDYHTTDGTPRFVIGLREYVQYSGDTALIRQLYPAVRASIEGARRYWLDAQGYLLHEDNETWMDARDQNLVAFTPRGSRANDIQALWYEQLQAGAYFAAYVHDAASQAQWTQLAARVKANFARDYQAPGRAYLADRLDQQGRPDFTLRPNQLYALDLVDDPALRRQVVRTCWQELVYPWGVASLNRQDPQFHPYHLAPELYHKDAAYHRGAVWLWNNGVAMQRMLELGQVETAYQLFANMNRQALTRGVVGGLSENMDAYPRPGETWPRITGTYLQAWSNAEQLRVWYQYFLGIRPDLINQELTLAPRLPAAIRELDYHFRVGAGRVEARYRAGTPATHSYRFQGLATTVLVDGPGFAPQRVAVAAGAELRVALSPQQLRITVLGPDGRPRAEHVLTPDANRLAQQRLSDEALAGVSFARPFELSRHPVMRKGAK
jgi:glycogen debranching enzyme